MTKAITGRVQNHLLIERLENDELLSGQIVYPIDHYGSIEEYWAFMREYGDETLTTKGRYDFYLYWLKPFRQDNVSVAEVSSKGVIKARSAGKCTVYVMAINGAKKAIKELVEA